MPHFTHSLNVSTHGPGLHDVSQAIAEWIGAQGITAGLLTALCRHTSASLVITENASPAVQHDMLRWFDRLAPQGAHFEHDDEGPDDMPAHLKSALTGNSVSIPVSNGRMMLGTWQGIFLVEHRTRPHRREIALHLSGDLA